MGNEKITGPSVSPMTTSGWYGGCPMACFWQLLDAPCRWREANGENWSTNHSTTGAGEASATGLPRKMVPVVVTSLSLGSTLQYIVASCKTYIRICHREKKTHLKTLVVGLQTNTGSAVKCLGSALEAGNPKSARHRFIVSIDIIVSHGTGTAATSTAPREIWPSCYATP